MRSVFVSIGIILVISLILDGTSGGSEPGIEETTVFEEATDGFVLYRILRNGVVQLLYCVEYMRCFSIRSDDDGKTWSVPVEITAAFESFRDKLDWQVIATGPGHGIELSTGRLIVPFWMASYDDQASLPNAAGVIFSDDGGATWQGGEIAIPRAGEANVSELSDGRTLMTARNGDRWNQRIAASSVDGATDWSTPKFLSEIPEQGCMAGMVSHLGASRESEQLLLFSNPNATSRKHQDRRDVTIRLSRDNGKSWPIAKTLRHGPSAYSDLAVLPDGTVLCFFESGTKAPRVKRKRDWAYASLTMARFDLDWLTSTRD